MGATDRTPEEVVARYLEQLEAGRAPALEEYLDSQCAEEREECRLQIEAALGARDLLGRLGLPPRFEGFEIRRELGRGSLGIVYEAWDTSLERPVALKVLRRGTPDSMRRRILDEARQAASLNHPSIVTVHSIAEATGDGGGPAAIVMELIEGVPLDEAAATPSRRRQIRLLRAVAEALAAAHERGVIHRDLKPGNVLVSGSQEVKVLDFGLAITAAEAAERSGVFEGTPLYASPEQVGGEPLTPASDVFSFGSLAFHILVGRPPFEGATTAAVLDRIREGRAPFPRRLEPAVPKDLQAITLACLARDPTRRPSARDVAADLGRLLAGEPARLRPPVYGDTLRRRIQEHVGELEDWERQGMMSPGEIDRLQSVYRRVLADEDHWLFDARRLSLPQTLLYTGSWTAVVAAALLTWRAWDELSSVARWALPLTTALLLLGVGLVAHARRDVVAGGAFLAGAVLASIPAILALLAEGDLAGGVVEGVTQLLPETPLTNLRILIATGGALVLSVFGLAMLRLTAFAWTTAALAAVGYTAWWLNRGLLDLAHQEQALRLLPLVVLEIPALVFERTGRVRWALPFHAIALLASVLALDVMADQGWSLEWLGVEHWLAEESRLWLALAANGLVFLGLTLVLERAGSLDLRRGARLLEILVPLHLLGALYANAEARGSWVHVLLYLGAVVFLLALGPWRSRRPFLVGGLLGVALGAHLLIDLGLVAALPFATALGAAGIVLALVTWRVLSRRG